MRAAEIVIGGLVVFFALGLVAGAVLVIAMSALRGHREAVRIRRMEQLDWQLRQPPGQQRGTGYPAGPPGPGPSSGDGPPRWPDG